jgi:hypothetical protein
VSAPFFHVHPGCCTRNLNTLFSRVPKGFV